MKLRKSISKNISNIAITASLAIGLSSNALAASDTIKVGILHSLSGTMAISETTLKDTMLMLIDEQNKKRWGFRQKIRSSCGRSCIKLTFICRKSTRINLKRQS